MISSLPYSPLLFKSTPVLSSTVNLLHTFKNGQTYTFQSTPQGGVYGVGVGRFWELKYSEDGKGILWRGTGTQEELDDYLALKIDYDEVEKTLDPKDSFAVNGFKKGRGMRLLRQDPWETFVGFLFSQNNNVPRIEAMVRGLCAKFGPLLYTREGTPIHGFPSVEKVSTLSISDLSTLGLGYRADYLLKSAQKLHALGGEGYLLKLRDNPDPDVQAKELKQFPGVGPKVADCISLFSLDCLSLVPVDTHMRQIYENTYKQPKKRPYTEARDYLRAKFGGKYAGVVQTILFTFETSQFRPSPPMKESDRGSRSASLEDKRKVKGNNHH